MSVGSGTKAHAGRRRILLVDDHPVVRQGLVQLIGQEPDLDVCAEAGDEVAARAAVERTQPDAVIVDISLKDSSGIALIERIKALHPRLPVMVLSMHDESLYAERALRAGASGYVMKHESPGRLISTIRRVLDGDVVVSEGMSRMLLSRMVSSSHHEMRSDIDTLSNRELEIFRMIGNGRTSRQIAEQLHVSIKTVESHRARIKIKLKLASGNELLQRAIRWIQSDSM